MGRKDEMLIIRGVNVFPSTVGNIVEEFLEIGSEYLIVAYRRDGTDELEVQVEVDSSSKDLDKVIATELKRRLHLRIEVHPVPKGTLVRSDYKGKRFNDKRKQICNAG